jgi:DUF4097 and DUF4098 domain-containing protein YvlB
MKKFIFFIVVSSIALFGLTSCSKQEKNLTHDFSLEKVKKININNNSWDLLFKSSQDNQIHVETSSKDDKSEKPIDIGLENGALNITQNDDSSNFKDGFTFGSRNKVMVYLPKDLSSPVNVENKNGDITIQNVSISDLKLTNSSDDITIKDSSIKKLQAESKSGGLYITNVSDNEIYVSTGSGDIVFKDFTEHQASDIKTGSGDISVSYKTKPTSLKLSVTSNSKDISVHLDDLKLEEDTKGKKEGTIGVGNNSLKADSNTGAINIR